MSQSKKEQYKRNYPLLVLEGSFFMGGIGFFNSNTIIPIFINQVINNNELVGLTITLGSFFSYFGRLFIGPVMPHIKNHSRLVATIMFIGRPQMIIPALFALTGHYVGAVFALMFSYSLIWFVDGLIMPGWSEVLANTVDESRHGRLLGAQMLIGGIASIGSGIVIQFFLSNPAMNIKSAFGWIFLIGGLLLAASCFMMAFTKNAPVPYKTGKVEVKNYYRTLPGHLRSEKDFLRMTVVTLLLTASAMCTPFIILFAVNQLGISNRMSALLILFQAIGIPLGGWLWGQLCDHFGCVTALRYSIFNILLIALLPIIAFLFFKENPMPIMIPALLLTGASSGIWSVNYIYTVQVVKPQSRSAILVLSSFIFLPLTFTSYLAGFISERFGYITLFSLCIVIALFSLLASTKVRPIKTVLLERMELEKKTSAEN